MFYIDDLDWLCLYCSKTRQLINQYFEKPLLTKPEIVEKNEALPLLKRFIDCGSYAAGDRLPSERNLIDTLGVTRNDLRKGLDALEREGAIWRHVGKGTFIAAKDGNGALPSLSELSERISPIQMMRARLTLEPAIARESATNASTESIKKILKVKVAAEQADSWDSYEEADDAFHRAIAESTDNILLVSLFDHMNQVRRAVSWRQVVRTTDSPTSSHNSFKEHNVIVAAIEARDPAAAHNSMRDHLKSVSSRLYDDL